MPITLLQGNTPFYKQHPTKEETTLLSIPNVPLAVTSMKQADFPPSTHCLSLTTTIRVHLQGALWIQASDLWTSGTLEYGKVIHHPL